MTALVNAQLLLSAIYSVRSYSFAATHAYHQRF